MRDVFHCTPSALAEQDHRDVMIALTCMEAEAFVRKSREGS